MNDLASQPARSWLTTVHETDAIWKEITAELHESEVKRGEDAPPVAKRVKLNVESYHATPDPVLLLLNQLYHECQKFCPLMPSRGQIHQTAAFGALGVRCLEHFYRQRLAPRDTEAISLWLAPPATTPVVRRDVLILQQIPALSNMDLDFYRTHPLCSPFATLYPMPVTLRGFQEFHLNVAVITHRKADDTFHLEKVVQRACKSKFATVSPPLTERC